MNFISTNPLCDTIGNADRKGRLTLRRLALWRRRPLCRKATYESFCIGQQVGDVEHGSRACRSSCGCACARCSCGVGRHGSPSRLAGRGSIVRSATGIRVAPESTGRPLPTAGGQPRRCTGARPNRFSAVGIRTLQNRGSLSRGALPPRATRAPKGWRPSGLAQRVAYFSSALAPASTSFFTAASASALATPSFDGLRRAVDQVLASFRPRPVIARTALMTTPCWRRFQQHDVELGLLSTAAAAAPPAATGGRSGHRRRRTRRTSLRWP